ncbi:LsmAD domain-containing protein [Toxoplasma gondii GAB2-2007-GAL-DOM2]|uniref:LsmAD domain-containing protein n=5 Tax=Toxoplasma gondii TaxID=5811 RepID=S7WJ46_TOXGG|nr:LsmAD domain-containing protein [Toxoplasma gondii GT1]KFG48544.1 LsmAD domain-containing protein [Toxoplasma gondii GAB2-2007-GAL-DOM2]KFG55398.1 LsmAD domain-containing protein [Toxoplasma gondii FOU]PUA92738.1 LsmAD domain-containing protein [Toxoplasma gondii TgCATBr9]RQX75871.1 LsmAD domain-containing protein [Toxoplasma gondii CAST]
MGKTDAQSPSSGPAGRPESGRKSVTPAEVNELRLNYCMAVLAGREVRVNLENGGRVQGLFHAYEKKDRKDGQEGSLVLSCARDLPSKTRVSGEIKRQMHLPDRCFVSFHATDVPLAPSGPAGPASGSSSGLQGAAVHAGSGFQTDTQISAHSGKRFNDRSTRGGAGQPRELQKWVGDGSRGEDTFGALEPAGGAGARRVNGGTASDWDQFAVNEQRFGVRSSYKEELYTTKLDLDAIPLQVQQQADRIATELEKQQQGTRDGAVDDSRGVEDEEALFSAVTGTGGYSQHRRAPPDGPGPGVPSSSRSSSSCGADSGVGGGARGSSRNTASSGSFPHVMASGAHANKSGAAGGGLSATGERGGDRGAASSAAVSASGSANRSGGVGAQGKGVAGAHASGSTGHVAKVAGGALRKLRENLEIAAKENQRKELSRVHTPALGAAGGAMGPGVASTPPPHKELHETHKKMRSILASGSPARAPAMHELGGIHALNLEPALPKLDDQTQEEWLNFKKNKNQQSQPGGGEIKRRDRAQDKNEFLNASKVFTQLLEKNKSSPSGSSSSGSGTSADGSPASATSSSADSSQSSSFGSKKGFQFNPHANAFTPSTPSHATAATLRGQHVGGGASALGANAYPHRPYPGVGNGGMMAPVAPQLGPGTGMALPGVGGPPDARAGQASAAVSLGAPGGTGSLGDHAQVPVPHSVSGSRHAPHAGAAASNGDASGAGSRGNGKASTGASGPGGLQAAPAGGAGAPGAPDGAVVPQGRSAGSGSGSGGANRGPAGHLPQGTVGSGGSPTPGPPQHLNPAGMLAQNPQGCTPPAHAFANQAGAPQAPGCWPGGVSLGGANAGLVAGVVVAGAGGAGAAGFPPHPQTPGATLVGPHPNHAGASVPAPAGAAAVGLMGPPGATSEPQSQAAAAAAAAGMGGALGAGGMIAGPGGAAMIPDGLAAGAMPFGMGGFAINSHMAQMNMMGGNFIGQPPPPPTHHGHQRQPPHQQALIGNAMNMRMGPGAVAGVPHPQGGTSGHQNGGSAPHYAPFQPLSAEKTGKGGRGSSGAPRTREVGEFVNSLVNKARQEKLSQISPEWTGLGTDSYRVILGQIPPTSFPQAATLPAAALSAPIAPFPILHPQLSAPLPAGPLFSLHPRILFPAGPQAFLSPAAGAPPHPGAMSYPLMYPPLPLAQHLSPVVSNPAAAAAVAAAAAAAAAHQGHASAHPGGAAQPLPAAGAPGAAGLPNNNQPSGVVATGTLCPSNGATAGAQGAGFQQSQLMMQQQAPNRGAVQPQRGVGAVAGLPCTFPVPQGQPQPGQPQPQPVVGMTGAMGQPVAAQAGPNFAAMAAALGHQHFQGAAAGGGVMGAAHAVPYVPQPLAGLTGAGRPLAYAPMVAGTPQQGLLHGLGAPQQAIMPGPPLLATPAAAGVTHPTAGASITQPIPPETGALQTAGAGQSSDSASAGSRGAQNTGVAAATSVGSSGNGGATPAGTSGSQVPGTDGGAAASSGSTSVGTPAAGAMVNGSGSGGAGSGAGSGAE